MQLSNHGHLAQQLLLILSKDLFTLLFLWLVGGGGGGRKEGEEGVTNHQRQTKCEKKDRHRSCVDYQRDRLGVKKGQTQIL